MGILEFIAIIFLLKLTATVLIIYWIISPYLGYEDKKEADKNGKT